jgi:hypothetical protein
MKAKLSQVAMATMVAARGTPEHPQVVRQLFAEAKRHYDIPRGQRIYANIDDTEAPDYGVIYRKKTGTSYDVPGHKVPVYDLKPATGSFVRVHSAEALAVLISAIKEYGTMWTKAEPATAGWAGTFIADYKRYKVLVMFVDGQYRFIAFSDALALLSMLGEPTDLALRDVPAGVLIAGDDLLIPA